MVPLPMRCTKEPVRGNNQCQSHLSFSTAQVQLTLESGWSHFPLRLTIRLDHFVGVTFVSCLDVNTVAFLEVIGFLQPN
jgi:hypothetical protein